MTETKKIIYGVATLAGTIIGVGFFSLPYVTSKVGIWIMLGYFLVLGSLIIFIHLFFGELSLKTPDYKRLPGFARIYLGRWAEKIAFISIILGLFGALLAYLIVGGEFLENLLSPLFGGNNLLYVLLYFFLGAVVIYFGIRIIAKVEFWGLILFFIILILIFIKGFSQIKLLNLFPRIDYFSLGFKDWFLPYGVVLFSLWGAALIPEVEEILKGKKQLLKKTILISILIPIIVYLFFIYLILGITGPKTTESALVGLKNILGNGIVSLGLVFGILTTFTSFIALGLTLKKVFWYDLKIKKIYAWTITCFVPLILYLLGIKSFILVIAFVGGIALGIDGILILLMYLKIKPNRKLLIYPLVLIFLAGIIYEIIYFIR